MTTPDIRRIVAEMREDVRLRNRKKLTVRELCERQLRHADELEQAISLQPSNAAPEDACNWQQEDDESDCWSTDCGNLFSINDGTPSDNQMRHCCYCGKKVAETPWAPEDEQDDQP